MLTDEPIWALGAMSGTSLDGVDAALVLTDGETITQFGASDYRAYSPQEQLILRAALGKWDDVAEATDLLEAAHIELLSRFEDAQVIGFHGQTFAHDPHGRGTFQAGDGAVLVEKLGQPVVWDFRSEDVRNGGEGAPLAPFFHFACAKWIKADKPICFLNLGGVGNLTWVDPSFDRPEEQGALLAFDTGPANAPLNDLMMQRRGVDFDADGELAASGVVSDPVVSAFLRNKYFLKTPPKSLDRNDFTELSSSVADLSDADAAATLTACIVASVVHEMVHCPTPPCQVLVTGGGGVVTPF